MPGGWLAGDSSRDSHPGWSVGALEGKFRTKRSGAQPLGHGAGETIPILGPDGDEFGERRGVSGRKPLAQGPTAKLAGNKNSVESFRDEGQVVAEIAHRGLRLLLLDPSRDNGSNYSISFGQDEEMFEFLLSF